MGNLYETISGLCKEKNVTGYRMCKDIGIQPSIMTDLKSGRKKGLSAEIADKIASYFNVSVGYLLGTETEKAPTPAGERAISDDDIKFALFGTREIDDDVLDRVKQFAKFAQENEHK